jgi:glucan endo-1,3-beta-D-glucosidase
MRGALCLAALAAAFSSATAKYQGFNYGAFFNDSSPKMQSDFEAEFKTAQNLEGAPGKGFNSARLYTTVVSHPLPKQPPQPVPPKQPLR